MVFDIFIKLKIAVEFWHGQILELFLDPAPPLSPKLLSKSATGVSLNLTNSLTKSGVKAAVGAHFTSSPPPTAGPLGLFFPIKAPKPPPPIPGIGIAPHIPGIGTAPYIPGIGTLPYICCDLTFSSSSLAWSCYLSIWLSAANRSSRVISRVASWNQEYLKFIKFDFTREITSSKSILR